MSEASNYLDNKLRELGKIVIPNSAARAYIYNLAGVDRMTNADFREDEIQQAREAWHNAQVGRQTKPIAVLPHNYKGDVADTSGWFNPLKNAIINPMRMTVGSMWVAPNGKVLHSLNDNFYSGDVYDFNKKVQDNKDYSKYYQELQKAGTNLRTGKQPMIIDLNLKDNK